MIVAIPTQAGKIAPQCDGTLEYTLVEDIAPALNSTSHKVENPANSEKLAESLVDQGVTRLLVSNITTNLESAFSSKGITVFKGAAGTIKDAIHVIASGSLDLLLQAYGQSCGGSCGSDSCSCGGHH